MNFVGVYGYLSVFMSFMGVYWVSMGFWESIGDYNCLYG